MQLFFVEVEPLIAKISERKNIEASTRFAEGIQISNFPHMKADDKKALIAQNTKELQKQKADYQPSAEEIQEAGRRAKQYML